MGFYKLEREIDSGGTPPVEKCKKMLYNKLKLIKERVNKR